MGFVNWNFPARNLEIQKFINLGEHTRHLFLRLNLLKETRFVYKANRKLEHKCVQQKRNFSNSFVNDFRWFHQKVAA